MYKLLILGGKNFFFKNKDYVRQQNVHILLYSEAEFIRVSGNMTIKLHVMARCHGVLDYVTFSEALRCERCEKGEIFFWVNYS